MCLWLSLFLNNLSVTSLTKSTIVEACICDVGSFCLAGDRQVDITKWTGVTSAVSIVVWLVRFKG